MVDKHNRNKIEKINDYQEFLLFNFDLILDMNLKKRHYQIIFYVFNKFLEWNCINKKQKQRIIECKNQVIKKGKKDEIFL